MPLSLTAWPRPRSSEAAVATVAPPLIVMSKGEQPANNGSRAQKPRSEARRGEVRRSKDGPLIPYNLLWTL